MDDELRKYLIGMEQRLTGMEQRLTGMEQRLIERIDAKTEHVETALLTEFHKWASPAEARARSISAALRAIDLEMEALTDRVQKLENPPQSQ